jgi:hypothetical protein
VAGFQDKNRIILFLFHRVPTMVETRCSRLNRELLNKAEIPKVIYRFKKLRIISGYITSSLKREHRVSTIISNLIPECFPKKSDKNSRLQMLVTDYSQKKIIGLRKNGSKPKILNRVGKKNEYL